MYKVVFEHDDFWVINKSAGIGFHDENGIPGICSILKADLQADVFPVHRLDKVTSGLLIFAKSSAAAAKLAKLFELHQIQKYYLAIIDKKPKKKQGLVKGDMERSRRASWQLLKTQQNPAVTQFFTASIGAGRRLVILKPHTGKTHQLRVALKSLGSPICGDPIYQPAAEAKQYDRTYLHAYCIAFSFAGKDYLFRAEDVKGCLFQDSSCEYALTQFQSPEALSWPALR